MALAMSEPQVLHVIFNFVALCACGERVLVLASTSDVECPGCQQTWRIARFLYHRTANGKAVIEAGMEPASMITVPGIVKPS